jgi:protoheme IX farnesyltransferase
MRKANDITQSSFTLTGKLKDYLKLSKISLSIMVVFSCIISFLLAPHVVRYDWTTIILLFIAGILVTGSANAINQVVEKDTDAMMRRTASRPVAAGRMSEKEGWTFAVITGIAGAFLLGYYFNWLAAGLGALSLFLYAFIYTPLKKVSAISVIVGAVPGAMPCLIGWAAAEADLTAGGWALFALQFLWQFPHFWAIAWIAHKDYTGAGFRLLPGEKNPTRYTALQSVIYSLLLVPAGFLPYMTGMSGMISVWIVLAANLFMVIQCVRLYREMKPAAARRVMFSSYIYLPVVLLALLADKIPPAPPAGGELGRLINFINTLLV